MHLSQQCFLSLWGGGHCTGFLHHQWRGWPPESGVPPHAGEHLRIWDEVFRFSWFFCFVIIFTSNSSNKWLKYLSEKVGGERPVQHSCQTVHFSIGQHASVKGQKCFSSFSFLSFKKPSSPFFISVAPSRVIFQVSESWSVGWVCPLVALNHRGQKVLGPVPERRLHMNRNNRTSVLTAREEWVVITDADFYWSFCGQNCDFSPSERCEKIHSFQEHPLEFSLFVLCWRGIAIRLSSILSK